MKLPFALNKNDLKTKYAPLAAGLAGLALAGVTFAGVTGSGAASSAQPVSKSVANFQAFARPAAASDHNTTAKSRSAHVEGLAQKPAAEAKKAQPHKARKQSTERRLLTGSTRASYFWDDGSGRQGDTGLPAYGKPMQKGLFSSPSWPLGTEGYVIYKGKKAEFFIGDRGPGVPSSNGVMLDIDGKTFAELTGGSWNDSSLTIEGNGGQGHIEISYVITKWGDGPGRPGKPVPFASGAWRE